MTARAAVLVTKSATISIANFFMATVRLSWIRRNLAGSCVEIEAIGNGHAAAICEIDRPISFVRGFDPTAHFFKIISGAATIID